MDNAARLRLFYERLSELYRIKCIHALLEWDQQVYMPPEAAEGRAAQHEYMARLGHRKMVDAELLHAVDELHESLDSLPPDDQVNVREMKRALDIQRKLPEDFVSEFSHIAALSYSTWAKARPENDFKTVEPYLAKMIDFSKRTADYVGYEEHPYDALLDLHDPGAKTSFVKPILLELAERLREIIPPIAQRFGGQEELKGKYDKGVQAEMCRRVVRDLGYSFEIGRLDTTAHPFMTTLGPRDFRITTRFMENSFLPGLYASIHEAGHALYEMGLPSKWAGTPLGDAVSCSVHESQSRMWENLVGRSREFCSYLSPVVGEYFPDARPDPEELWMLANHVEPSLIRVEADEVTYSQHIVIRMILEIALVENELSVADLPGAWSDLYEKYLGIRPSDYKDGVMQDVHWYSGSLGYFPTYALGNLYGAMMMESARKAIPDLDAQIRAGQFGGILGWLRKNVHQHGMRFRGPELIERIAGDDPSVSPFVEYLMTKFLD